MNDYFSKQKRGGVVGSKIEHQDSVGIILALELRDLENDFSIFCNITDDYHILCEGNDDIEILTDSTHIICSKCSKELLDEYTEYRYVIAPVPYPFNEFKNIDNIYDDSSG